MMISEEADRGTEIGIARNAKVEAGIGQDKLQ